jgi:hypothetical protein
MSHEDISPSSKPFTAKIEQLNRIFHGMQIDRAIALHDYIDLAKRSLLEHRVRDFTAADVVALAIAMAQRPAGGDDL